jgi:hypothetical protein
MRLAETAITLFARRTPLTRPLASLGSTLSRRERAYCRAARYKIRGFASRTSPYTAAKIDSRFGFDQ